MRIKQLQSYQKERGIDSSIIFFDDPNFKYFTGLSDVYGALIIPSKKKPVLLISSLEKGIARKHSLIKNIVVDKDFMKLIPKNKKLGINKSRLPVSRLEIIKKKRNPKFADISSYLNELRLTKTSKEISMMKKSCYFASKIMAFAIKKASRKLTEIQLKRLIEMEMLKHNLKPSFETIVAAGKNSGNPHHIAENKKLKGFAVIDLGVIYKNYCSDMTRTIYVGTPSKSEIDDYNKVLKVHQDSLKLPSLKTSILFKNAKKTLGKYLTHALGHGIGIEVHEHPIIRSSKSEIKNDMIFTIEPGLYKKTHGIRIEDTVLYKNKKVFILTKLDKKLKVIK
jgi:Xaa-Pro dipeptidase